VVDVLQSKAGFSQAISNRSRRKSRRVLHAIEALFFHRRHQRAIAHHGRRRVPVIRINAQNIHAVESVYSNVGAQHRYAPACQHPFVSAFSSGSLL